MTAIEKTKVLDELIEFYGALSSYQDTGYVISEFRDEMTPIKKKFKTLFRSPSYLHMSYEDPLPFDTSNVTKYEFGSNGKRFYRKRIASDGVKDVKFFSSIEEAVVSAQATSSGAISIFNLLMSYKERIDFLSLSNVQMIDKIDFYGVDCRSIKGRDSRGMLNTIYYELGDYPILRGLEEEMSSGKDICYRENIIFNAQIPVEIFDPS